ncbi:hypothetical protein COU80_02355 [Candidatus Peregrinibacteria bacterium CG10_big_fil_rev_8_21_14_0_10_55_24]|nr:MAG: hypothetical protein COU80_02355 [Candidatus Peregrinibacteria bacterium CG10_big_fil_rev_8_21_14_0_10_55_24]
MFRGRPVTLDSRLRRRERRCAVKRLKMMLTENMDFKIAKTNRANETAKKKVIDGAAHLLL